MSMTMGPPAAPSSVRATAQGDQASDKDSATSESDEENGRGMFEDVQEGRSPTDSVPSSALATNPSAEGHPTPLQKRRRVTRACDECRRKKIKCDGKQPCTHCEVYSYECTYDKPSNRRRNPPPQYVEALEDRLRKAESLLSQFLPDVDLADPNLDPTIQQEFRNRERARALAAGVKKEDLKAIGNPDAQILSMIESLGQLDINEKGAWDFHGTSSGAVFLKRIQEHFPAGMLQAPVYSHPFLPKARNQPGILTIDSPSSAGSSPWTFGASPSHVLPPRDTVQRLCYLALNCATCLLRIVHVPTFYDMVERVYTIPQEAYEIGDTRFLGLLHAVMALGCLYDVPEDSDEPMPMSWSYTESVERGARFYTTARMILQDITECQDLTTLQALLFMILFLQGTTNMTGCYAFVGIAFRSAITMGLHRHIPHPKMNKIEDQVRRRVFYIIRQMDTYVSAILGFPIMNIEDAVDQPYPTEVNDEHITDNEIKTPPSGTPSFLQAFNAHTRLMEILARIVRFVYPLKGVEDCVMKGGRPNATYLISYKRILEVERDLQDWLDELPDAWKPSNEGDPEVVRVRHLLRFAYAHVQMMLYRPFIHYSSPRLVQGKTVDQRAFHCAASAINVSRNIIHIGTELRKQGVLIGPYWFILYTELFSILSLVFYVLENPEKAGSEEILADATTGREMIAGISTRSQAAEKVSQLLNVLFEKLPEKLGKAKSRAAGHPKKRSAPASKDQPAAKHSTASLSPGYTPSLPRRSTDMTPSKTSSVTGSHKPPAIHRRSVDSSPSAMAVSGVNGDAEHAQLQPNINFNEMGDISCPTSPSASSFATSMQGRSSQFNLQPPPLPSHSQQQVRQQHHHQQQQRQQQQQQQRTAVGGANPAYNDMFSSTDPFAYPNQPLLDLVAQQQQQRQQAQQQQQRIGGSMNNVGPHRQDSSVFGGRGIPTPGVFDASDLEGQLVQIPAFLMEGQGGTGEGRHGHHHGFDGLGSVGMYGAGTGGVGGQLGGSGLEGLFGGGVHGQDGGNVNVCVGTGSWGDGFFGGQEFGEGR